MTTFLEFSDDYSTDEEAIELSTRLTQLANRVAVLKQELLTKSSWFGGSKKKPSTELRKEYEELGDAVARMCAIELAKYSRLFRAGTNQQKSFQESSLTFLQEFKSRW